MRISPDKLNKLAHAVADTLAEIEECPFLEDRDPIRRAAREGLGQLLIAESQIDHLAAAHHRRRDAGVEHPL